MRPRFIATILCAVLAACAVGAPTATATFPGRNGEIAVTRATLGDAFGLYGRHGALLDTFGPGSSRAGQLSWSADGGLLAYVAFGTLADTVAVDAFPSGAPVARIPMPVPGYASGPAFSPDGRRVAFSFSDAFPDGVEDGGVYIAALDGSAPVRLSTIQGGSLSWSPRGGRILLSNAEGIWSLSAATGAAALIVPDAPFAALDWAPDGWRFAYGATVAGNADIYVASSDGSQRRRLTFSPAPDRDPTWAPDGRAIAFVSTRDGVPAHDELYAIRPWPWDGARRLTVSAPDAGGGFAGLSGPAWRPLVR